MKKPREISKLLEEVNRLDNLNHAMMVLHDAARRVSDLSHNRGIERAVAAMQDYATGDKRVLRVLRDLRRSLEGKKFS